MVFPMTRFFTADHHFWHGNIIRICNRPFENMEEMHEELIRRWNERVNEGDIVFHLGDFSFRPCVGLLKRLVGRLNGRIVLILGNHDKNEARRYIDSDFYDVTWHKRIKLKDRSVMLQHYPKFPWPSAELGKVDIIIHGHTHHKDKVSERGIHVGVDAWDFYPISEFELINLIEETLCADQK
jgi:calcineurin-like phosphoesterase family protein